MRKEGSLEWRKDDREKERLEAAVPPLSSTSLRDGEPAKRIICSGYVRLCVTARVPSGPLFTWLRLPA